MRQKCVKMGLVLLGKEARSKMRQKCVKFASKMRGTRLGKYTFWTIPVKTCAVLPVFARVVGQLRAADPSHAQGPVKQNARPGDQSEVPRPRWKQGQEQNPGPENQDNQHMLEQPRGYFPEFRNTQHNT